MTRNSSLLTKYITIYMTTNSSRLTLRDPMHFQIFSSVIILFFNSFLFSGPINSFYKMLAKFFYICSFILPMLNNIYISFAMLVRLGVCFSQKKKDWVFVYMIGCHKAITWLLQFFGFTYSNNRTIL